MIKANLPEKEIIEKYNELVNLSQVAKLFDTYPEKIRSVLLRNNISINGRGNIKYKDNNLIKEVVRRYENGESRAYLRKELKIHSKVLVKMLKANNIEIRNLKESLHTRRKLLGHDLDKRIFARRDEETAYYCGLLLADGYLLKNRISLELTDVDVIYKFANFLGMNENKIITRTIGNWKPTYSVAISCDEFINDLKQWGIGERKTYNFIKPNVPLSLLPAFLRGIFDGDGAVYHPSKDKTNRLVFKVTTHNDCIKFYYEALRKLGVEGNMYVKKRDDLVGDILIYKESVLKEVFTLLQGTPNLSRKWDKINNWLTTI